MRLKSAAGAVWLLTFLNGVYLLAFGDPTLVYFLNMLAHLAFGVALIVLVAVSWRKAGWLLLSALSVATIIGIAVLIIGGTRNHESIMRAHVFAAFACL